MPLRDHFHRPNGRRPNWDRVHGLWPGVLVQHLNRWLPAGYAAAPQIHVGEIEVDVGALEVDVTSRPGAMPGDSSATQTLPLPILSLDTDPPDVDEYALRVYEASEGERLVASVEFVSPANKDRPERRRQFVAKCAGLLRQGVCVSIIDVVTLHHFNLYADLLDFLGHTDPGLVAPAPPIYAVTLRHREGVTRWHLDTWPHPLQVGQPLHGIPLWVNDRDGTLLDLETTYEETCQTLRLPD
jgi:hypothetical protein